MKNTQTIPQNILDFWFGPAPARDPEALGRKIRRWFGNQEVNAQIRERFSSLAEDAVNGGLADWEETADGRLALIVILDQFTRSIHGAGPRAYAGDARAVRIALGMLDSGEAATLDAERHQQVVMPLGHSEDLAHQERGLAEARALVARAPENLVRVFEVSVNQCTKFLGVITRFGRFPHRNATFGRQSTPEELVFLETWPQRHPPADMEERIRA